MRALPGTTGTRWISGSRIFGRRSCSESRSVGNVPGVGTASELRTLTTSRITRETGRGLSTGTIWRACATGVTAAKPCGICGKIEEKMRGESARSGGTLGRLRARLAWSGVRRKASGFCLTQGVGKKFGVRPVRPQANLGGKNFPHGRNSARVPGMEGKNEREETAHGGREGKRAKAYEPGGGRCAQRPRRC